MTLFCDTIIYMEFKRMSLPLGKDETKILVGKGDLICQKVTAIVNAANNLFLMGGGLAAAIKKKGGLEIEKEAVSQGPITVGEAVVTGAGRLSCQYVIHAATMGMDFQTDQEKVRLATRNSLLRAQEYKMDTLAFPALGCGVGRFPAEEAARIMAEEVVGHILTGKSNFKEIRFVLFDGPTCRIFEKIDRKSVV